MAEPGLIAAYLTELRYSTSKLPDLDDIVAEVEDHLLMTVAANIARGQTPAEAEAEALARFGSAELVARVFIEQEKRGGAVSTTLTRRAGFAAMLAPPMMLVGGIAANAGKSEQPLSGIGVALCTAATVAFVYGLIGLRVRHGGLGMFGRVAFWLGVVAIPVALPFAYAGIVVLAVEVGLVVVLIGVGMHRARILPRVPVALFAFTLPAWALVWLVLEAAGLDKKGIDVALAAVLTFGAFMTLGLAMSREPALDARGRGAGPLATVE
ncbi:MAG: hypothetical protein HY826_02555 [Actinobacteria bacterium]|nr:hypothetical protein [Actinomycetota bacterium]